MNSLPETRDDRLERVRQVARETLIEHCAAEHLSVADFERRMRAVAAATSEEAVRAALADLPGRSSAGPTP